MYNINNIIIILIDNNNNPHNKCNAWYTEITNDFTYCRGQKDLQNVTHAQY